MDRKILMSLDANEVRVAVLEENKLEEFYIERADEGKLFGNIYKGKVKTVIPGMGAAFVDLGTKKDGFLYVGDALQSPLDLDAEFDESVPKPQFRNRRGRRKNIEEVLKVGQEIIVQIVKEPLGNKGPRLTTHFSIPARYLVMMPGEEKVGVSKRIGDRKERDRIRQIFKEIDYPRGAGFIVRTAGEGKTAKEFSRDIRYLTRLWKKIHGSIDLKKAPSTIHEELNLVERMIRDHLSEETDTIIVDHPDLMKKVKRFIGLYLPGSNLKVEMHSDNRVSLFEKCNIEKEIERTFAKNVYLKSGGYIVIEQTEGLVAIDVNTGKFTGNKNLEETVYKTNLEAAHEVARQLRLRDIGGIIIIDFIDMERGDHRRNFFRTFNEAVLRDRAKINILKMSELGLVEMTRQRMRPSLESAVYQTCPYCEGKGMVKSVTTMAIQTIKDIRKAVGATSDRTLSVYVHPDVADRLCTQEKKALNTLERITRSHVGVFHDSSLHIEDVNITFIK